LGPTLPHGNQEDRCSCGLFAINTIEHRVLGHPLGILNTDYERARWFNLTAKDQIPDLRVPGLSATLPAIEMNVLLSGQVVANQESEIRRIKDMKTSYLEKQAQRRASRNEALAGHEPEKMDLDRTEKEKVELESVEKEKMDLDRTEKEKVELESVEKEKMDLDSIEKEDVEIERMEKEKVELEMVEKEQVELERVEREKVELERVEKEKVELEMMEREKVELERVEKEKMELDGIEREKVELNRIEKEKVELQTLQGEKVLSHPVCDLSMDDYRDMDVDMPPTSQVTLSRSLAMDIEPGEIPSHSNDPCLYKGKGKAIDHGDRSPHHTRTPPPRHGFLYYRDVDDHHPTSPRHRPSTYRDYVSFQRHHNISPPRGRSRSPVRSTHHNRLHLPMGARAENGRYTHNQSYYNWQRRRGCKFSSNFMTVCD
jgi:hypothetical protein